MAAVTPERMNEVRDERIAELAKHGISASRGTYLGQIVLNASAVDRVLRLLAKIERLEASRDTAKRQLQAAKIELFDQRTIINSLSNVHG
jgi:hypothetical protein